MPCKQNSRRIDGATGRAKRGSQWQIQTQVNFHREEFSKRVISVLSPPPSSGARLRWVSPLAEERFDEYQDEEFLDKLGLRANSAGLKEFWPSGGPCWDALAIVAGMNPQGVVMVEAKSHILEMGSACRAGKGSRERIEKSLAETALNLNVRMNSLWTDKYYQIANRYAHLHFLREKVKITSWLVNVYFTNDYSMDNERIRRSVSGDEWRKALKQVKEEMGLGTTPVPFASELFIDAVAS
jgi:hypothetical protein